MAKYKHYSYEQRLMIPVSLEKQVLPGTFEYTLNTLIDNKLDLSIFHQRYKNDETGVYGFICRHTRGACSLLKKPWSFRITPLVWYAT